MDGWQALHRSGGGGAAGASPSESPLKSRPTVRAWFMTLISNEDDPCRPKGTTFHSNWPNCERKLVFHRSEVRTRS
jgi:hypothetical protein